MFYNFIIIITMMALVAKRGYAFTSKLNVNNRCNVLGRYLSIKMSENNKNVKKGKKGKDEESKYSRTVLLPQTTFDQRANSIKREPELQKWWEDEAIYKNLVEKNTGDYFTLHDGPPYANGNLHIGHALNKILKDFINKYQTLRGKKVCYVPGWDCHGLPIELKVLQSMKQNEREGLTPISLRKKAAEFAKEAVDGQMKSFKRYGIWGEWKDPYLTLQPEYEAAQIRVFGDMVLNGHIYQGKKPVHWSPSSRTALAEAELEYPDNHVSRSIYIAFDIISTSAAVTKAIESIGCSKDNLRVAIWTTTPWTIPANLAVAVNGALDYCIASHPNVMGGKKIIVAKDLVATISKKMGLENEEMKIESVLKGDDLVGTKYKHPLYERVSEIVIGGDYITTDSGTGLVHTAPGHGVEDYQTGLKYGLPLLSPVNDLGQFTEEAGSRFFGKDVLGDGNQEVINALTESGTLLKEEAYNHKYPYDWRTKKPTIFRATQQWFASVSNFRDQALKAIDSVQWVPTIGRNRIYSMTESRGDWCISRQRSWGVPIPVFYNKNTNEPLLTQETISHIEKIFREKGSDSWWELPIESLLPEGPLREQAGQYTRGTDTMDVWFDSGTSWAGVSQARKELNYPADIYLEGSDQHRGWFQSSLLTSVASKGIAPYKTVLTHGFVLDEKGFKMSKSLGNVVDPQLVIEGGSNQKEKPAYGADTLRLWVSGVDYSSDVCLGDNIMKQTSESYRKLRNTLRYLVGSLSDFDPVKDTVPVDQLPSIDKYILGKLTKTAEEIENAYDNYEFYRVNQALTQFSNLDLSSFYLVLAKDRLYISGSNEIRRRTCQTVLYHIMEQMAVLMAPIVPHMSEDLWQNIPYKKSSKSVFEKGWVSEKFVPHEMDKWESIRVLLNDVNMCIERARAQKEVGASQECRVIIHSEDSNMKSVLKAIQGDDKFYSTSKTTDGMDDLRFIFGTSQVLVVDSIEKLKELAPTFNILDQESESGMSIGVTKAFGKKCDRCWYYSESVGEDHDHDDICLRCADVIKKENLIDKVLKNTVV